MGKLLLKGKGKSVKSFGSRRSKNLHKSKKLTSKYRVSIKLSVGSAEKNLFIRSAAQFSSLMLQESGVRGMGLSSLITGTLKKLEQSTAVLGPTLDSLQSKKVISSIENESDINERRMIAVFEKLFSSDSLSMEEKLSTVTLFNQMLSVFIASREKIEVMDKSIFQEDNKGPGSDNRSGKESHLLFDYLLKHKQSKHEIFKPIEIGNAHGQVHARYELFADVSLDKMTADEFDVVVDMSDGDLQKNANMLLSQSR